MGFSRQKYWSGLPCRPPGDLPHPEAESSSPASSVLQVNSLPLSHQGSPVRQRLSPFRSFTLLSAPLHKGLQDYCLFVFCSSCGWRMARSVSSGSTLIFCRHLDWSPPWSVESWGMPDPILYLDDLLASLVGICGLQGPGFGSPAWPDPGLCCPPAHSETPHLVFQAGGKV